jgi:hypothetical protein
LTSIDFENLQARFDAYWRRESLGRPLVAITCPMDDRREPDFPVPDTVEGRWTDIEYQCDHAQWEARNTVYLGDAFPMFWPNVGPDSFTAYLGADLQFLDDQTSWVRAFVDDLADYTPTFDRSNRWWQHMCDLLDALCEVAAGKFLIGIPDLHGGGDSLAAVRHPDKLALDLYDKPDQIKRIMPLLTDIYKDVFDEYYRLISRVQEGSSTWVPAYSRGKYTALQNDFSGLIAPEMFAEFFLPYDIVELSRHLDNSLYHLDGPAALGNLPYLLRAEELDGIQWEPGVADRPMSRWVDVCRRILDAGKCLQIATESDVVMQLLAELPPGGLFISTACDTEARGRDLFRQIQEAY